MRRTLIGVGVAVLVIATYVVIQRMSPEHQIKALVKKEADLVNAGDLQGVFDTFSQRMQATCSIAALTKLEGAAQGAAAPLGLPEVSIQLGTVDVTDDRASATATASAGPGGSFPISASDPLLFVKTAEGWKLDSAGSIGDQACTTQSVPG